MDLDLIIGNPWAWALISPFVIALIAAMVISIAIEVKQIKKQKK
jgi:hypothetical protein